jgi:hypothetical protein
MNTASNTLRVVAEGLIYGFTFALGWVAALLLVGTMMA